MKMTIGESIRKDVEESLYLTEWEKEIFRSLSTAKERIEFHEELMNREIPRKKMVKNFYGSPNFTRLEKARLDASLTKTSGVSDVLENFVAYDTVKGKEIGPIWMLVVEPSESLAIYWRSS